MKPKTHLSASAQQKSKSSEDTQAPSSLILLHIAVAMFASSATPTVAPETNVLISGFKHGEISGSDVTFGRRSLQMATRTGLRSVISS